MDVVYFGEQNWHVTQTAKQHLSTRLTRRGQYRILFVDPDPSDRASLRREGHNLWVLSHRRRLPKYPGPRSVRKRLRVARALPKLGFFEPVAVVSKPWHDWEALGFVPSGRVYFAEDEWSAMGGPEGYRRTLAACEPTLAAGADVVLAVSATLRDKLAAHGAPTYLQENGVDPDHFAGPHAEHPTLAALPKPRLGFVGQIDVRMDMTLLTALARRRPAWQFVFVGRVHAETDASPLRDLPNATLVDFVTYAELPGVLASLDVATIPYLANERGRGCNPLKAYEYLAAGLPTVATPLPGLGAARDHVRVAAGPDAWESAIEAALADRSEAAADARRVAARAMSWDVRTDEFERRLHEARERRGTAAHVRQRSTGQPTPRQGRGEFELKDAAAQRERLPRDAAGAGKLLPIARLARLANVRPAARALVARANSCHLGDLLAAVPLLRALRERDPSLEIDLGVDPPGVAGALLAGSPWVDRVFALGLNTPPKQRLARVRELAKRRYRLLLTGTANYFSAALCLCGAKRQVGLDDGWPGQRLLTERVPLDQSVHESDNALATLRRVALPVAEATAGVDYAGEPLQLDEPAIDAARADVRALLEPAGGRPVLLVHPGSKRPSRRMPVTALAEAVRQVVDRSEVAVALTGVGDEAALARDLATQIGRPGRVLDLCNQTTLPGLVALVDCAACVLSPDTGVMHLARFRGRPLVALLGPGNDRRWGPYPRGAAPAVALRQAVPCAPCDRWACEFHWCMRSLAAGPVAEQVLATLADPDGETALQRIVGHRGWHALSRDPTLPELPVIALPVRTPPKQLATWITAQAYPALRLCDGSGATLIESAACEGRATTFTLELTDAPPPAWDVEFRCARIIADQDARPS